MYYNTRNLGLGEEETAAPPPAPVPGPMPQQQSQEPGPVSYGPSRRQDYEPVVPGWENLRSVSRPQSQPRPKALEVQAPTATVARTVATVSADPQALKALKEKLARLRTLKSGLTTDVLADADAIQSRLETTERQVRTAIRDLEKAGLRAGADSGITQAYDNQVSQLIDRFQIAQRQGYAEAAREYAVQIFNILNTETGMTAAELGTGMVEERKSEQIMAQFGTQLAQAVASLVTSGVPTAVVDLPQSTKLPTEAEYVRRWTTQPWEHQASYAAARGLVLPDNEWDVTTEHRQAVADLARQSYIDQFTYTPEPRQISAAELQTMTPAQQRQAAFALDTRVEAVPWPPQQADAAAIPAGPVTAIPAEIPTDVPVAVPQPQDDIEATTAEALLEPPRVPWFGTDVSAGQPAEQRVAEVYAEPPPVSELSEAERADIENTKEFLERQSYIDWANKLPVSALDVHEVLQENIAKIRKKHQEYESKKPLDERFVQALLVAPEYTAIASDVVKSPKQNDDPLSELFKSVKYFYLQLRARIAYGIIKQKVGSMLKTQAEKIKTNVVQNWSPLSWKKSIETSAENVVNKAAEAVREHTTTVTYGTNEYQRDKYKFEAQYGPVVGTWEKLALVNRLTNLADLLGPNSVLGNTIKEKIERGKSESISNAIQNLLDPTTQEFNAKNERMMQILAKPETVKIINTTMGMYEVLPADIDPNLASATPEQQKEWLDNYFHTDRGAVEKAKIQSILKQGNQGLRQAAGAVADQALDLALQAEALMKSGQPSNLTFEDLFSIYTKYNVAKSGVGSDDDTNTQRAVEAALDLRKFIEDLALREMQKHSN